MNPENFNKTEYLENQIIAALSEIDEDENELRFLKAFRKHLLQKIPCEDWE